MQFVDTNIHLLTKPFNVDLNCQSNFESYEQHIFFWTKGGQNFLFTLGGFYNEREYSGADWLHLLLEGLVKCHSLNQ